SQKWSAARKDACQAGIEPPELMELKAQCLDERLDALRALVDVLCAADAPTVVKAVDAVEALPSLDRCARGAELKAGLSLPTDPGRRRAVEALRQKVAQVHALHDAGKYHEALAKSDELLPLIEKNDYPPLLADALTLRGRLFHLLHRADEAASAPSPPAVR